MSEPNADEPRPDPAPVEPEQVEAEPYDRAADAAAGARVHEAATSGEAGGDSPGSEVSSHTWAMACHLAGLADFAHVFFGLGIILPLAIWLALRHEDPFVDQHGKEAVNFQINLLFWTLVFAALSCCLIGIPFLLALQVAEVVLVILASIEASNGRPYRYPLIVRVIR